MKSRLVTEPISEIDYRLPTIWHLRDSIARKKQILRFRHCTLLSASESFPWGWNRGSDAGEIELHGGFAFVCVVVADTAVYYDDVNCYRFEEPVFAH